MRIEEVDETNAVGTVAYLVRGDYTWSLLAMGTYWEVLIKDIFIGRPSG